MAIEQERKQANKNPKYKEFESLLNEDFKERKLKENEIIKATVTEITKNFVVVDCKAKMEGMIPIEEFKHDSNFEKLKVGSTVEVYLERIESFKGEIVISREKAKRMVAWKKMEKIFDSQEEVTGYITGKVKGGVVCTVDGLPTFMPSSRAILITVCLVIPSKKQSAIGVCSSLSLVKKILAPVASAIYPL